MGIPEIRETPKDEKTVLLFWAPWHDASVPDGPMDQVLEALASSTSNISYGRVNAEECESLTKMYKVTMVPSFVLLNENGSIFRKIEGVDDVSKVTEAVSALAEGSSDTSNEAVASKESLNQRLSKLISSSNVMLFMKGAPDAPRCGFSRQIVEILNEEGVEFGSFDILTDEEVRQGLKTYSEWPTYPQLYVKGELIGGLDIVKELKEDGSLKESLEG